MIKLKPLVLEQTDTGYDIYCDLDGVLCDFNGAFKELSGGIPFDIFIKKYDEQSGWDLIGKEGPMYWATLNWLKDGKELWKRIKRYDPIILSAPSQDPSSIVGKKIWVKKNLGHPKAIYVPAKEKQKYSNKNSILIDDYERNITQWVSHGGIGILHTSTASTLKQLGKYL